MSFWGTWFVPKGYLSQRGSSFSSHELDFVTQLPLIFLSIRQERKQENSFRLGLKEEVIIFVAFSRAAWPIILPLQHQAPEELTDFLLVVMWNHCGQLGPQLLRERAQSGSYRKKRIIILFLWEVQCLAEKNRNSSVQLKIITVLSPVITTILTLARF